MRNSVCSLVPVFLLLAGLCLTVSAVQPASAQDQPAIAKDSVRATAHTYSNDFSPTWLPGVEFRIAGPLASGSQPWAEFSFPGKKPWLKFDCQTLAEEGGWWCGVESHGKESSPVPEGKSVAFTGMVDFVIHIRNELQETETTLFKGKMKVAKAPIRHELKVMEFYVDEDWRIPIAYLLYDDPYQAFRVFIPFRGDPGYVQAYIFYQGKEVDKDICFHGDGSANTAGHKWGQVQCKFESVHQSKVPVGWPEKGKHLLSQNPGEYEIKVMSGGHMWRSVKFTVAEGGSFDNGIASSNQLGSDRVIVPVRVIGDSGPWDRTAWKTGAFYGNPLTGFTPAP